MTGTWVGVELQASDDSNNYNSKTINVNAYIPVIKAARFAVPGPRILCYMIWNVRADSVVGLSITYSCN